MRALVVFPGRGSYGASELGTLKKLAKESAEARAAVEEVVAAMDAPRIEHGRASILEIDGAKAFDPAVHLIGENASALTVACGLVDARLIAQHATVAGFVGNSLGFYTALGASGALRVEDVGVLVETIVTLQAERGQGGQILVPVADEQWRIDAARVAAVESAVEHSRAFLSVDLGSFRVLAGDDFALASLERALGKISLGGRTYPVRLAHHQAFHTPLLDGVAEGASELVRSLEWYAPSAPLVLGTGAIATPWSADPRALAAYTTGEQITTPFQFRLALRAAIRELAPDAVVLTGPGESIGGSIGAAIVAEGWKRVTTRAEFQSRQGSDPVLLSAARPEQRSRLLGG